MGILTPVAHITMRLLLRVPAPLLLVAVVLLSRPAFAQGYEATPTADGSATTLALEGMRLTLPGKWSVVADAPKGAGRFRPESQKIELWTIPALRTDKPIDDVMNVLVPAWDEQFNARPVADKPRARKPFIQDGLPGMMEVGLAQTVDGSKRVLVAYIVVAIGDRFYTFALLGSDVDAWKAGLTAVGEAIGRREFTTCAPLIERLTVPAAERLQIFNASVPMRLGSSPASKTSWESMQRRNQFSLLARDNTVLVRGELVPSPAMSPRVQLGNFAFWQARSHYRSRKYAPETVFTDSHRLADGTMIVGMIFHQKDDDGRVRLLPAVLVSQNAMTLMLCTFDWNGNNERVLLDALVRTASGVTFSEVKDRPDIRDWLVKHGTFNYFEMNNGAESSSSYIWKWTFKANGTVDVTTSSYSSWSITGNTREPLNPYNASSSDWLGMNANNPVVDKPWMMSGGGDRRDNEMTGVACRIVEAGGQAWILVREPEGQVAIHRLRITQTEFMIDGFNWQSRDNRHRDPRWSEPDPGRPTVE